MERCGFDQKVRRRVANFAFCATHNAAQCDCSTIVGDHDHFFIELVGSMVDRDKLLFRAGRTHDDFISADLRKIKCVQRLTALHHDVIRNVDHIVDAANADCS